MPAACSRPFLVSFEDMNNADSPDSDHVNETGLCVGGSASACFGGADPLAVLSVSAVSSPDLEQKAEEESSVHDAARCERATE